MPPWVSERATYFGAVLTGDELVPGPDAHFGITTYDNWAAAQAVAAG